jgi:nicotinamidase-related amidase
MTDSVPPIDPRHAALLVMDYQPGIIGRMPDPEPLLARVNEAIAAARDAGATVGYVRVAFAAKVFPRQGHVIATAQLAGLLSD